MGAKLWSAAAVGLTVFLIGCSQPESPPDSEATVEAAQEEVIEQVSPAVRPDLQALTDAEPSAEGAEGLGLAMLAYRHLDEAAYFYAVAAERDPGDPRLMTSLGALALELLKADRPLPTLGVEEIVALQREALRLEPGDPAILNNLAAALRHQGGEVALAEAITLQRQAVAADPDDDFFGARLAQMLMEAGQEVAARDALTAAFLADPTSVPVAWTNALFFDGDGPRPAANRCTVDFRCDQVCPQGIIGRVNFVTCQIANSSAVGDCEAGRPFATAFNCEAQMPRFGILIPGLDPGFSLVTPWGSLDVVVQGDGRIDFRAQVRGPSIVGPARTFFSSTGSYQPSNGEVRIRGGTGVSVSVPANNSAAIDALAGAGLGPSMRGGASAAIHYDRARPVSDFDLAPSISVFRAKIVG